MVGQRQIVDPPSFTPTPYGLLSTVDWQTSTDVHWQNGITYVPLCGVDVTGLGESTYDECIAVTGTGGAPAPGAFTNVVTTIPRGATSFVSMVEFDCAPVGNEQAQQKATQALAKAEPWQVERAFWTGKASTNTVVFPHLAANSEVDDANGILLNPAAVIVTGTPMNVEQALGALEQALVNCYGGVGVIHVPQVLLPTMDAWGIVKNVGPIMYTLNGNKVAVGGGYPGSAPDGTASTINSSWMYATGTVFGYRSAVRIRSPEYAQAMDRSTNTVKMIAERTYVIGWDCCPQFAVNVKLGVPTGP